MDAIRYYSGWDHASLLKGMNMKAESFDTTKLDLLRDFKIHIANFSLSASESHTKLEEATTQLSPALREICLFIQKIVFWILGVTALTDSITNKQQAIDNALGIADPNAVLNIFPLAKTSDQGEKRSFTIQYSETKTGPDGELVGDFFIIRFEGEEVMTVTIQEGALSVDVTSSAHIRDLAQVAAELARKENSTRLEISAPATYCNDLKGLKFQTQHQPDVERSAKKPGVQTKSTWWIDQDTLEPLTPHLIESGVSALSLLRSQVPV